MARIGGYGFLVCKEAKPQPKLECINLLYNIDSGNDMRDPVVLRTARTI